MASTIVLKRRIGSIKNTRQITKAMQLVSASKLRRAQEYAQRSRAYANLANELLQRFSSMDDVSKQPLFASRPVRTRLYVLFTSNSGLAGAYNANVLKQFAAGLKQDRSEKVKSQVIAVGGKGAQFVRRLKDVELVAVYPAYGDQPTANDMRPLLNTITGYYREQKVDDVHVLFTKFVSAVSQVAQTAQLLPVESPEVVSPKPLPVTFEPSMNTVIDQVAVRLIEAQVWQAVLESLASEHAMRMIAMKNATDNAKELIDDYTLELNTARQAAITQELAEITGGAEALNG